MEGVETPNRSHSWFELLACSTPSWICFRRMVTSTAFGERFAPEAFSSELRLSRARLEAPDVSEYSDRLSSPSGTI